MFFVKKISSIVTVYILRLKKEEKVLTLTKVFEVFSDRFAVINKRSFSVEVRRRSVGQRVVVEMVEAAVVGGGVGRAEVQERPAEEL